MKYAICFNKAGYKSFLKDPGLSYMAGGVIAAPETTDKLESAKLYQKKGCAESMKDTLASSLGLNAGANTREIFIVKVTLTICGIL